MSSENVELAKKGFEQFVRGDVEALLSMLDPRVEWFWIERGEWDCHSREDVEAVLRERLGERLELQLDEVIEAGDQVVVGVRGRELDRFGAAEPGRFYNVVTFRDGKVVRMEDFARREDALAAAGLAD